MKVHKLTAGDGYTYLTRQVAAVDATHRGRSGLAAYYTEKGEAPGVWMGRGLGPVLENSLLGAIDSPLGEHVTEEQMQALFGEGRHPNARAIEREAAAAGLSLRKVDRASMLGRPYHVYPDANEFRARCRDAFAEQNSTDGLPRDWPIDADRRAAIRSHIAREMFVETYRREPIDARELSGHLARISRQATTAVAGYDLTFSPVKSVSTLWAIAPRQIAQVIEQAHHDAVADTVKWIEDHAAYTRRGRNGVAQVDVRGLIAVAFDHRDSRAGDPDLHTHVAISNKVQALDGAWLALDGRAIYKNNVPASERYNTRLEALLVGRLGVRFADREPDGRGAAGRHPIREIVGIDGDLPRTWSKRRIKIDFRRAELSRDFQARHGRPPTTKEAGELAQRATLETRQHKHAPRSHAEQRATWRAEAIKVLGGEIKLRSYLSAALLSSRLHPARHNRPVRPTDRWTRRTAATVLNTVQQQRAVWQENHIRAEAERRVRAANVRAADIDVAVDAVVARALHPELSLPLDTRTPAGGADTPAALRRRDGSSVYTVAGSRLYTSTAVVEAERAILAAAAQRGGHALTVGQVDLALLEAVANGVALNPGQAQLVRELATSGARVQLALAPAGTGKTTAMRALSAAWTSAGGTVIGLAPSATAAAVLREEIGARTDTVAKLLHDLTERDPRRLSGERIYLDVPFAERHVAKRAGARWDATVKAWYAPDGEAQLAPGRPLARWRDWLTTFDHSTLLVIDEAGMAATTDLDKTIAFVLGRGGSVRLIGDDQQLAAIGAGGVLRDIAAREGAVTLSQVMRFVHPTGHPHAGTPNHAEGSASLALRDGDPAALAYYLDHGRVHVGDLTTCVDDAYDAWRADRAAGRDALMLAPTRDLVTELNARARADRFDAGGNDAEARESGPIVQLADRLACSAGDTVISRENDRSIPLTRSDWVKNGDRWTVETVLPNGALQVTHLRTRRRITLPAGYVAEHVELGYACTIHAAQGVTADACHTVATGEESRQLFYVAMSRGRSDNHVYLATVGDGDRHAVITRDAMLPPTAVDILTRVLGRDDAPVSATSASRNLADPATCLHHAADLYFDALTTAAVTTLGADRLAAIDAAAEQAMPHLTDLAAYPALRAHLALCAVAGEDPAALLTRAATAADTRGLDDARDAAAVLDWRLDFSARTTEQPEGGPLPWLPPIPGTLADDRTWGRYLQASAIDVRQLAEAVRDQAQHWTPTEAPSWAKPLLDLAASLGQSGDPSLTADVAVWRAATGVPDDDWCQTGEPQLPALEAHAQRRLNQRISRALGDPNAASTIWSPLASGIDTRILSDPYWPILASRLSAAARAGIDITALASSVIADAPLPDEQPAAALWWRLSNHLTPAATTADARSARGTLRPDWIPELAGVLGEQTATRIAAEPAWPGLVAAVTHGAAAGWQPADLLDAAYDLLRGGQDDDLATAAQLRPGELATALTWRVSVLTDADLIARSAATARASGFSRDAHDESPDSISALDVAWLNSLPEPDPTSDDEVPPPPDEAFADTEPPHDIETVRDGRHQNRSRRVDQPAEKIVWVADDGEGATSRDALYQYPAAAAVPRDRVVELNQLAADFYAAAYSRSWAASYVAHRLARVGDFVELSATVGGYRLGYAPDGWTTLTDHLHAAGATDPELVAAGLASYASTGRLIDTFRDRLVFPITAAGPHGETEIHGFIARRNPAQDNLRAAAEGKESDRRRGPKYLNTAETDLFKKGREMFGAAQARSLLAEGATPVLVEGPMDAIAVTLAGAGRYAGLAPMGTRLTDQQADQIVPPTEPASATPRVIVATDTDHAGLEAAHRAYWQLVLRGDNPRRLSIGGGKDPAEVLQRSGAPALRVALDASPSLASALVTAVLDGYADRFDTVEGSLAATRRCAELLAALPPDQWAPHLSRLVRWTGTRVELATEATFAAHDRWLADPIGIAQQQSARRLPAPVEATATSRWAPLANSLNVRITADAGWPSLAAALERAAATGYNVNVGLPALAAQRPLPTDHLARTLEYRLLDVHPAAADTTAVRRTFADDGAARRQAVARLAVTNQSPVARQPALPHADPREPLPAAPEPLPRGTVPSPHVARRR